jgi:hypothetical protein
LCITFVRQTRGIIWLAAVFGSVTVASAALAKLLLARPVIAFVKVMVRVPTSSTTVVTPLSQLLAFISFDWRLSPDPRAISMVAATPDVLGSRWPSSIESSRLLDDDTALGLLASLTVAAFVPVGIIFVPRLVEELLDTAGFAQLPQQALVSPLHSSPAHFLKPVLEGRLTLHFISKGSLNNIGLDALAGVLCFGTLANKLLCKSLVAHD